MLLWMWPDSGANSCICMEVKAQQQQKMNSRSAVFSVLFVATCGDLSPDVVAARLDLD